MENCVDFSYIENSTFSHNWFTWKWKYLKYYIYIFLNFLNVLELKFFQFKKYP